MNRLGLFCLFLMAAGLIAQQVLPTRTCDANDGTNTNKPVLTWLARKGVTLISPVMKPDSSICGGSFKANGTCCNVDSLVEYVKKANEGMATKWKAYVLKLTRVKQKYMTGIRKMLNKINLGDIKKKWTAVTANSKISSGFTQASMLLPQSVGQVAQLKAWIANFDKNIVDFKTQGKVCFDAMRKARANFFCAACSFDAAYYTNTQSSGSGEIRFRVDKPACASLVNSCYPVWKFNFYLTTLMQYLNVLRLSVKGDTLTNKFASQAVLTGTQLDELRDTFERCDQDSNKLMNCTVTGTSMTNDTHALRLCKNAFVVNKENGYLEGDDTFDEGLGDSEADALEAQIDASATTRLLQAAANAEPESTDPTVGVDATTDGTVYGGLSSSDSQIIPTTTVETSNAGDDGVASKSANILGMGLVLLVGVAQLF